MNNIQENLFRTIETIADKKIGQIKFDKTVEAIVESDKNKGAGEYSLKYQDVIFVAYTASNTDSFKKGDNVLVLIPEGDMSNRKTIISSSKREGEGYVDVENIIDRLSANMVAEAPDFEIELSTTKNETVDFNINKTQMINSYVGKKFLAIGAELYTNINTEDIDGMYGIALDCIFLTDDGDRIPYTFEFTNLHVTGNPFQARGYKEVQLLLPKERLVDITRARAFSRGFSKGNEKIKMKNLVIQYVSIREQDTSDYIGKIIAPKGTYFRNGSLHPDEKLSLIMEFRQKGEVLNTSSIEYKWFIMNSKINDITNPSYHPDAGLGWEWIKRGSYDEELISGGDTNNVLVSSAFVPNFLTFKCVATYKELKVSVADTITLVDHTDNISIDIDSSNGISFVNGLGETTLTCNVRQNNEPVDEALEYEWTQINSNQEPTLLQKGSRNNVHVVASTIGTKSTFTCQVVEANTQNPIGTGYTTLVNVTEGINEGVNIIGGFRTVLYDGFGVAPTNLPKEGFQFELTSNGEVVTENIEWYWKIPAKGKTMLTLEGASLGEDGQQISKAKVLHLGVQSVFDIQKNQNYVELEVRHTVNGIVRTSTAIAVISITKVGQNGADGAAGHNGLDGKTYVYHLLGGCPSVTYNKEGKLPQPATIPPIELMFSVDGDNRLAKDVDKVEWYIQGENESLLSFRGSEKNVRTKTTTKTEDDFNPHVIHLDIEDTYALSKFNNFVAATITYKDRVYREVLPISVIKNGSDGEQGEPGVGYMLNITGGNRGIAYSAIGTEPEPSAGGEFSVELLNNTEVLTPSKISWTAGGNFSGISKVKTFRPVVSNTYSKVSTFVNVAVEYNGVTINQTIPIICTKHADGLDWLEDWNNNSVIVDEKGRKIISPKMFAGTKDSMGRITGVALGRDVLNHTGVSQTTGIIGYKSNLPVFALNDKAEFYVSSRGNAGSVVDGTGNGIFFDGNELHVTGRVSMKSGTVGGSGTDIDAIVNGVNGAVQQNKVVSSINLSEEGIKIQANKLELQGLVTDKEFTKLTLDVNGITGQIGKIEETAEVERKKLSVVQQTLNKVTTRVESAETKADRAETKVSEVVQTVNGITSKVDAAVQTATDAKNQATKVEQTVGKISSVVEETQAGLGVLQGEFAEYEKDTQSKFNDVDRAQQSFENEVRGAFKDGVISESEAKILKDRMSALEVEREEMEREYAGLSSNPNIVGTEEGTALDRAKQAADMSFESLLLAIKSAVSDGKVSEEELLRIELEINKHKVNMGLYREAFVKAVNKVGEKYSNIALDAAKVHTSSEITQTKRDIMLAVSSVEDKVATNTSDIRRAEQKITADAIVSTVTSSTKYQNDKRAQDNAISKIEQKAGQIEVSVKNKVGNDEIINKINLSEEGLKIKANKVEIKGDFLVKDDLTSGNTLIQGATIKSGTISGTNISGANIQGTRMLYMAQGGTMSCDGKTYIKDLYIPETHSGWNGYGAFSCGPSAYFDNSVHVGQKKGELWIGNQGVIKRSRDAWIQIDKMAIQNGSKTYVEVAGYNSNHVYGIDIWYSDAKLKDNVNIITTSSQTKTVDSSEDKIGLNLIKSINHYNYDFHNYKKVEDEEEEVITTQVDCGYMAQNLQEHNSQLVHEITQGDGEVLLSPRPSAIIPNITLAMQEQQQQIEELQATVTKQQEQIDALLKLLNDNKSEE